MRWLIDTDVFIRRAWRFRLCSVAILHPGKEPEFDQLGFERIPFREALQRFVNQQQRVRVALLNALQDDSRFAHDASKPSWVLRERRVVAVLATWGRRRKGPARG